jgi:hypothetical protein
MGTEMTSETAIATSIAFVGAFASLIGGGVAIFNARMAVAWKRAELANAYMKDFNNNEELVFAGRCLDWNGGRLALPESLRSYLPDRGYVIEHDRRIFAVALSPRLTLGGIADDPRVQIYRTSIDSFLTWLSLIASGLDRKLFLVADIQDVGYWVQKVLSEPIVMEFIRAYGYETNFKKLITYYQIGETPYKRWRFGINPLGVRREEDG